MREFSMSGGMDMEDFGITRGRWGMISKRVLKENGVCGLD
jgi:hypothetical protein